MSWPEAWRPKRPAAGRKLALAIAREMRVEGFGLELDLQGVGNNGHYAPFSWQGALS